MAKGGHGGGLETPYPCSAHTYAMVGGGRGCTQLPQTGSEHHPVLQQGMATAWGWERLQQSCPGNPCPQGISPLHPSGSVGTTRTARPSLLLLSKSSPLLTLPCGALGGSASGLLPFLVSFLDCFSSMNRFFFFFLKALLTPSAPGVKHVTALC